MNETRYHEEVQSVVQSIRLRNRQVRIDEGKVRKAVRQCRKGKAPGWDGIKVGMIKEGFDEIKEILFRL